MCPPTNSLATIPSFSARELKACSGAKVHSSHVSRLVKARGGGFGGWKTGLKREEFATGFSCASLLFCALCFCQFVICVVQLIAEINASEREHIQFLGVTLEAKNEATAPSASGQ